MYLTPFDHFMKTASTEALVHGGPPGMPGVNPGWADSDGAEASNTDFALMRAQQNAAPILATPDADGGAGYSHPPAGMSPNVQAHTDIKMATIISEAEAFADHCYREIKEAAFRDHVNNAAAAAQQFGGRVVDAGHRAAAAAAPHVARATAAAQDLGGRAMAAGRQYAGQAAAAAAPYVAEGRARLGDAGQALTGNAPRTATEHLAAAGGLAAGQVRSGLDAASARAAELGGVASAHMSNIMAGAQERLTAVHAATAEAAGKAQAYLQNGVNNSLEATRAAIAQHPVAATGIGVAGVAGLAGAGVLMNRQMQEQRKQAALAEADELGRLYALEQLGLL